MNWKRMSRKIIWKTRNIFLDNRISEKQKRKKTVALRQLSVITQDIGHFQKINKFDYISFR